MWTKFLDTVKQAQAETGHNIILKLNPVFEMLPLPITRFDDPFLPFGKEVIQATQDLVCGYMFDMASYMAMAGAGAVALERTIRYVPKNRISILHGPFSGDGYSPMADVTGFGVDAITVSHTIWLDHYINHEPHAAFAMEDNPTAVIPEKGGIYHSSKLWMKDTTLRLTGNNVLYADKGVDYIDAIREALKELA